MTSASPSFVTKATDAPRRSRSALVATVVPCARKSGRAATPGGVASTMAPRMARTGSPGVDSTLATSPSAVTRSVNVPPVSTPTRTARAYPATPDRDRWVFAASTASWSTSSFMAWPACALIQRNVTSPRARTSSTNGSHRSRLATGLRAELTQPRRIQPSHQRSRKQLTTYVESLTTSSGPGWARTASYAAVISIRWLVVWGSWPDAKAPPSSAHAQPPGPGLWRQAPSVNTVVDGVGVAGTRAPYAAARLGRTNRRGVGLPTTRSGPTPARRPLVASALRPTRFELSAAVPAGAHDHRRVRPPTPGHRPLRNPRVARLTRCRGRRPRQDPRSLPDVEAARAGPGAPGGHSGDGVDAL